MKALLEEPNKHTLYMREYSRGEKNREYRKKYNQRLQVKEKARENANSYYYRNRKDILEKEKLKYQEVGHFKHLKDKAKGKRVANWKGESVGYSALHRWVRRWKGIPSKCLFCGIEKTTPRSIQWANKSHEYKRELDDWISLCNKCHFYYDEKDRKERNKNGFGFKKH